MSSRSSRTSTAGPLPEPSIVAPPDMVRFGTDVRDYVATLKRRTGIRTSNVLCRWALCRSLAEPTAPSTPPAVDTVVEMTWKVFSGQAGELYWWLVQMRCHQHGFTLDEETLTRALRAHVARGAAYLVGDATMRDASSLASLALAAAPLTDPVGGTEPRVATPPLP